MLVFTRLCVNAARRRAACFLIGIDSVIARRRSVRGDKSRAPAANLRLEIPLGCRVDRSGHFPVRHDRCIPSAAEIYRPWCAQYMGKDGARNCGFTSYEQCMMTATPGSGAHCVKLPSRDSGP
jgi:hypothetical protein